MDKILGMGNALVDVLVKLDNDRLLQEMDLPKGSMQLIDEEKFLQIKRQFNQMETFLATGGSAGNTILGLAELNASTGFIGKVGNDEYGQFYRDNLAKHDIEDKLLLAPSLPSGIASTFISPDGERTFGTFLGAASALKAEDLSLEMFKDYSYFYIEGYLVQDHDMILHAIELAKEAGLQVCLDMSSYNIVASELEFFTLLINKYVDILFANEEEARAYTGEEPEQALELLSKMCSIVILKLGSKGSCIRKGTETVHVMPYQRNNVTDTTGAGDYYASGFLYGLTSGSSLEKCAKIGSLLSGHVIQYIGAKIPDDCWNEIKLNINEILSE
ncbi:adenosine kinase [Bacteroides sp. 214]|uniref:adenosine kinase n=1 Tax=Bacteroides sp. 214 TaxID=2302935 RepID=UPI0013D3CC0B|nr:adenosine kinase [Bacteroides sp. 214]NDW13297.1 adenosine kinase [Bacteroides sp. 214]